MSDPRPSINLGTSLAARIDEDRGQTNRSAYCREGMHAFLVLKGLFEANGKEFDLEVAEEALSEYLNDQHTLSDRYERPETSAGEIES